MFLKRFFYSFSEWWEFNMKSCYYGSYPRRIKRFYNDKILDFLTPHYRYPKKLFDFLIEETDTKLLDCGALYFYMRTRGVCKYFYGYIKYGKVHIEKIEFIENGKNINSFARGVTAFINNEDANELENNIEEKREVILNRICFTKKQTESILDELLNDEDFDWDYSKEKLKDIWKKIIGKTEYVR